MGSTPQDITHREPSTNCIKISSGFDLEAQYCLMGDSWGDYVSWSTKLPQYFGLLSKTLWISGCIGSELIQTRCTFSLGPFCWWCPSLNPFEASSFPRLTVLRSCGGFDSGGQGGLLELSEAWWSSVGGYSLLSLVVEPLMLSCRERCLDWAGYRLRYCLWRSCVVKIGGWVIIAVDLVLDWVVWLLVILFRCMAHR